MVNQISSDEALKNYYHLKHIYEITHPKAYCDAPPLQLFIEASSFCNLKCAYCVQADLKRKRFNIDKVLFKKVLSEIAPYKSFIGFSCQGEPLLHKELPELVRMTRDAGLLGNLNTNATLLTKEKSIEIIKAGIDYMTFSFSAASKKIYEKFHVGAKCEKTLNNILNFLDAKAELGAYDVRARVLFVESDLTRPDKDKFLRLFSMIPIDQLTISCQVTFQGYNQETMHEATKNTPKEKQGPCHFLWRYPAVTADGLIRGCVLDTSNTGSVIGNAKTDNFMECWNNKKMQELRQRHLNKDFPDFCQNCNETFIDRADYRINFTEEAEGLIQRGYAQAFKSDKAVFLKKYDYLKKNRTDWMKEILQ